MNKKVRKTHSYRERLNHQGQLERDKWELSHLGDYEDIRPYCN